MRIPFLHKEMLALYPVDCNVKWAYMSTMPIWECRLETGMLQFDGVIQWEEVAEFIAERGWGHAQIVVRLNPLYVRHFIIQGPVVETVNEFDRWISHEVASKLPAGAEFKDFLFRSRILFQDEDSLQCLVGLVRSDCVETELSILRTAGIIPIKFSGLFADIDLVARDFTADVKYSYVLMVDSHDSLCLNYQNGILVAVDHFKGLENEHDLLEWQQSLINSVMKSHPSPEPGQLLVSGDASVFHHLPTDELLLMGLSSRPWNWTMADTNVEAQNLSRYAMIEGLRAELYAFNFLTEEHVHALVKKSERKPAIQIVVTGSGILVCLLTLVLVLQLMLSGRLEASKGKLVHMSTQMSVLEKQNQSIKQLEEKLQLARRFVGERTTVAGILTQIGKSIPENVWLDNLVVSNEEEGHRYVLLEGVAVNEQDVAILLGLLELLEQVSEVELVLSESVFVSQLYRKENLGSIEVTRFHIKVRLPIAWNSPLQDGVEAS